MLDLTGKTCEKGSKIVFFGGNGNVRISTLQEKLLLISPVRLILYTDTLKIFFVRHVKLLKNKFTPVKFHEVRIFTSSKML